MSRQRKRVIKRKLKDQTTVLSTSMAPIDELFMSLYQQQEGIITRVQAQSLMAEHVPKKRLKILLEHILSDPLPRYEAFLLALKETGQTRIIRDILEEQVPKKDC